MGFTAVPREIHYMEIPITPEIGILMKSPTKQITRYCPACTERIIESQSLNISKSKKI